MTQIRALTIAGMHCASCGILVDEELEALDGVIRSTTDTRRGIATVEFDPDRVAIDQLVAAVSAAGYAATPA